VGEEENRDDENWGNGGVSSKIESVSQGLHGDGEDGDGVDTVGVGDG
jgi:hypothetical protein